MVLSPPKSANARRKPSSELIEIGPKKKIGFVCSGGATKAGAFHLGVALALQERGFRFYGGLSPNDGRARPSGPMDISTYVGSSAGSIISTYLAAGYTLDQIFNSFLGKKSGASGGSSDPAWDAESASDSTPRDLARLTYQKMFRLRSGLAREQISQISFVRKIISNIFEGHLEAFFQLQWLKATGIFSTAGIEQYLREEVLPSNRFQDYLPDLFIVATQLNDSRKVVFGKRSFQPPAHDLTCLYEKDVGISEACAASTALPVIFAPYPIRGGDGQPVHYIDGEIRDTLSTHVAIDAGADLVFASYTHQPYHFLREIGSLVEHGLPAIVIQSIYLVIEQKINNHIYNKQIQRNAIQSVHRYCLDQGIPTEHRNKICELLEKELHHRLEVDTIYIHPSPTDSDTFFGEHFSLSPKKMAEIVRSGFRAATEVLRKYQFADRKNDLAIGTPSSSETGFTRSRANASS